AAVLPWKLMYRNSDITHHLCTTTAPRVVLRSVHKPRSSDLATPFAEPTSFTGFEPVTDKPMVAHHPRSAIPLGACPSTVTVAPLYRLSCSVHSAISQTS